MLATLADIKLFQLETPQQELTVLNLEIFFKKPVSRIFIVHPIQENVERGDHAHKSVTQLLICLHGSCKVTCHDGEKIKTYPLQRSVTALLIPPTIWAKQYYELPDTKLMVVCDEPYNEEEYLRNYDDFLKYRRQMTEEK